MNQWLGLRIGKEGNLFLEITKTKSNVGNNDEKWCIVTLEIKSPNIQFSLKGEIITNYEIKKIINNIKDLLDNKIENTIVFETLEPYFKFIFNKDNIRLNINYDLSNDYYSIYLDKNNIKKIYEYLNNFD